MTRIAKLGLLGAAALGLQACSSLGAGESGFSTYAPVSVKRVSVGDGTMSVAPPRPWNRVRPLTYADIRVVEDWTLNGPYLDGITFVSGLPSGEYLIRQRKHDDRQVPRFRASMTVPEVTAMLESAYRVRGGAVEFHTLNLQPRTFMGYPGFQFDFEHLDGDELWRKGRAVGAIIDGHLYLLLYDAARSHYYANALPDFEAMANNARLNHG